MTPLYEGLGDKLSNTDPISNSVLISGLEFPRDGSRLLLPGRYPMACFNSYIHESLHYQCFRTPVGFAISYLYHRAFLRAVDHLALGENAAHDDHDVLEDIARVETVLHIMRPLAEGIALFGEFDAFPGQAKSLSPTFRKVAAAFAATVPDWETKMVPDILEYVLAAGRAQPSSQRRKENLLMQGFSTESGGYLPGYFLVKNLQLALYRQVQSPLLLDSEFFLHFLIHWFYVDFNLVATLLDEDKEMNSFTTQAVVEKDSINAIFLAFQQRFAQLFTLTAAQVEQVDYVISGVTVQWHVSQIGMASDAAHIVLDRMVARINELIDYSADGLTAQQSAMSKLCHDNFVRRDYMCVGSFAEEIQILANQRVMLSRLNPDQELPVMNFGESEKPGPFVGRATIDVLQSDISQKVFIAVYADNERVTLKSFADGTDEECERLIDVDVSTERARGAKELMRTVIDHALPMDGSAHVLREHYRMQAEEGAEKLYRKWCGALMAIDGPEADLPSSPGALYHLCDRDANFLRSIAALGCVGGVLLDDAIIAKTCATHGLTLENFLGRAQAIEERHSFRFFTMVGDMRMCTV
ncbi:hypothetical protein FPZ24_02150 [Sphingomonas panacisoli]|uniref:Uncharacterized protein n=1 Tax=Sphingomonas panacisoli TaxID=1813879 RepID=A0A5B8LED0_9SPHN|nr:hypothetical protein [Sphingomonas panacisoli]QDZ06423.1 hypothetical protein FPZ24_02150 [Sphingomonas panacisoli]